MTPDPAAPHRAPGCDDLAAVEALLGRRPQGAFEVVVRDTDGSPVVLRNAPFLDDGTPMPTRYWLVGRRHSVAAGRLEAEGGVRRAEAEIDPAAIADAHRRYAAERDAAIEEIDRLHPGRTGPRPSGGVGGTREGVKCLHAHLAWYLAGGDDPVGAWTVERMTLDPMTPAPTTVVTTTSTTTLHLVLGDATLRATILGDGSGEHLDLPVGLDALRRAIAGDDPPAPNDLTNAIGLVTDHLDDLVRELPSALAVEHVVIDAPVARVIAAVEVGGLPPLPFELHRDAAEDVFRTVATEPLADRRLNPGLPQDQVQDVVAGACAVVALMRHLHLPTVLIAAGDHP